jgi:large subunit ribosomal protein L22
MARKIAPGAQEAIATARYIRISPTKARQVVELIRGRHVEEAKQVLRFSARAASAPVGKVLDSAVANAENNSGLPADELIVARAWGDEGQTLRRFRPRAMGRATRIRKRTCHISLVVGRVEEEQEDVASRGRKSSRKGTRAGSRKSSAKKSTRKKTTTTAAKSSAKKTTRKKTTRKKTTRKSTKKKETGD